jgi:RNA polymerase sigma-32 factor
MVASTKFLTREEELELILEYKRTGNLLARNKVILSNQKFVLREANKYVGGRIDFEDLVQEANIGLLHALDKFEPERGLRFMTYASWWIKSQLTKYLFANSLFFKSGKTQAQRAMWFKLVPRMDDLLFDGHTMDESFEIVADEYEMSIACVRRVYELLTAKTAADYETASPLPLPDDLSSEREQNEEVRRVASSVCSQDLEKEIVSYRFLRDEPMTLHELAKKHNLSREWIRQVEIKLLKKMREAA